MANLKLWPHSLTDWLTHWQCHLLSCPGQLKIQQCRENLWIEEQKSRKRAWTTRPEIVLPRRDFAEFTTDEDEKQSLRLLQNRNRASTTKSQIITQRRDLALQLNGIKDKNSCLTKSKNQFLTNKIKTARQEDPKGRVVSSSPKVEHPRQVKDHNKSYSYNCDQDQHIGQVCIRNCDQHQYQHPKQVKDRNKSFSYHCDQDQHLSQVCTRKVLLSPDGQRFWLILGQPLPSPEA